MTNDWVDGTCLFVELQISSSITMIVYSVLLTSYLKLKLQMKPKRQKIRITKELVALVDWRVVHKNALTKHVVLNSSMFLYDLPRKYNLMDEKSAAKEMEKTQAYLTCPSLQSNSKKSFSFCLIQADITP